MDLPQPQPLWDSFIALSQMLSPWTEAFILPQIKLMQLPLHLFVCNYGNQRSNLSRIFLLYLNSRGTGALVTLMPAVAPRASICLLRSKDNFRQISPGSQISHIGACWHTLGNIYSVERNWMGLIWKILSEHSPSWKILGETWLKDIREHLPSWKILGRGGEAGLKIPREYPSRGMALSGAWFNDTRGIPT